MTEPTADKDNNQPRIRIVESTSIPVYNCHVFIQAGSPCTGRVANLDGIAVTGASEREVLQQIVAEFKKAIAGFVERGEVIPWREPMDSAQEGEIERLIPIHL